MENRNGIETLIEKIPKNGMSKKCQELLPFIGKQYFNEKPAKQLEDDLGKKNKGYVEITYRRLDRMLDQIKINALKKPCGYSGKHPLDIKDDPALVADIIIKHCIDYKLRLQTKLLEIFKDIGITKSFLDRRYNKGKELETDRKLLVSLGNNPNFYIFMMNLNGKD